MKRRYKPLPYNPRIWNGQAVTGANEYVSLPVAVEGGTCAFEIQMTGTPTGTFQVEVSDQYDPVLNPAVAFVVADPATVGPTLPIPAGAPVSYVGALAAPATNAKPKWLRLRYTNTSGTGVLDTWVHIRGLG